MILYIGYLYFQTPGSRDDISSGNISDTFDDIAAANAQQEKVEQIPLNISTEDGKFYSMTP